MTGEALVTHLAARGDGVTDDGRYVPNALPGDTLMGNAFIPGPHHVIPPCRHFHDCGGCQLQHADEEILADFVRGRILGALAGIDTKAIDVRRSHLSPPHSRRRASLRAEQTASGLIFGFSREQSREIIDLDECFVLTASLFACLQGLKTALAGLVPTNMVCSVIATETRTGFDIVINSLTLDRRGKADLASWAKTSGVARLSLQDEGGTDIIVQRAVPMVRFGGVDIELTPGAFLQATEDGEAALLNAVESSLAGASKAADLFCGLGTFALPMSGNMNVTGIDAAGPAVKALERAARGAGRNVMVQHRDLFRRPLSVKELDRFDALVLDPPRAGAKAQVEMIAASDVETVCYVSCNPNTFARDARTLVGAGFQLVELWPVGQFRWSLHVELAARFMR
ncbi:MAG: class I SAM-dependent RNA methyltransferase [Pacificimonas sp.]